MSLALACQEIGQEIMKSTTLFMLMSMNTTAQMIMMITFATAACMQLLCCRRLSPLQCRYPLLPPFGTTIVSLHDPTNLYCVHPKADQGKLS